MKRLICIILAAASLGGCVVLPVGHGHGHRHHGYADAPVMVVPPARPMPYRGYERRPDRGYDRGNRGGW